MEPLNARSTRPGRHVCAVCTEHRAVLLQKHNCFFFYDTYACS